MDNELKKDLYNTLSNLLSLAQNKVKSGYAVVSLMMGYTNEAEGLGLSIGDVNAKRLAYKDELYSQPIGELLKAHINALAWQRYVQSGEWQKRGFKRWVNRNILHKVAY